MNIDAYRKQQAEETYFRTRYAPYKKIWVDKQSGEFAMGTQDGVSTTGTQTSGYIVLFTHSITVFDETGSPTLKTSEFLKPQDTVRIEETYETCLAADHIAKHRNAKTELHIYFLRHEDMPKHIIYRLSTGGGGDKGFYVFQDHMKSMGKTYDTVATSMKIAEKEGNRGTFWAVEFACQKQEAGSDISPELFEIMQEKKKELLEYIQVSPQQSSEKTQATITPKDVPF